MNDIEQDGIKKNNYFYKKYFLNGAFLYFIYWFFKYSSQCHDTFSMTKHCRLQTYDTTINLYLPQVVGLLLILSFVVYKRDKSKGAKYLSLVAGIIFAIIVQKFI